MISPSYPVELLVSPADQQPLEMVGPRADTTSLRSPSGAEVPIRGGIPRFVDDDGFAESFGFQWTRFEVRQPGEDEATFKAKTGVPLDALKGLRVLDAGCGGGRYTRIVAEHGGNVLGVDRSRAIEKAAELTRDFPSANLLQADLLDLPLKPGSFDLVFSIGVIHHSPDARAVFRKLATLVRPGGRLSVWVYRRNAWPQEVLNDLLRWGARRVPRSFLLGACQVGAFLGGVPIINRTLNKIANFSNHPRWENRVCDTFDWYSPQYQSHHTVAEVMQWFEDAGFEELVELPPEKGGKLYRFAFNQGWIIGSGVNVTGVRTEA